jgi:GT2 family glycosyltransferase
MASATSLATIVIVAHNNWPDLELAILSALRQTWSPVEVIVVDNASSDRTPDEVPRLFGDRVVYIRQPNLLDGGGYNRGIRQANGAFIQVLDGDDMLAVNKIERQMEVFLTDPSADIVYGDVRRFQSLPGPADWTDMDAREHPDILAALLDPATDGAGLLPGSMLFRRNVFERVGPWDETMRGADQDFWLRAAAAGCTFRYSGGALCFYRVRPNQMSADSGVATRRMIRTLDKARGYVTDEPYRSALLTRLARLTFAEATTRPEMSPAEARRKLEMAYQEGGGAISRLAYLVGLALVSMPGAVALSRHPLFRWVRSGFARLLRLH